ncbi:MAG: hypothetical protein QOD06_179 [Candidatus Binatota bacterium]|jgi:tol-pal system protein YbgF|nr:hypothetical protein [Candidatus Binatota bacterium]
MSRPLRHLASPAGAAALVLVLVGGCATQDDYQVLRQEVSGMRQATADNQAAVTSLRDQVQTLRGEMEQLKFQAGQASPEAERLQTRISQLEARLSVLEQTMRSPVAPGVESPTYGNTPGSIAPPPGVVAPTPAPPPGNDLVTVPADAPPEYREGVDLLQRGEPQSAIQKLREYLRRSPKSDLSDDAQYLIGEAYYRLRDFNRAILEFNEVLLRYPKGDRVPAALLRQALAFAELGDKVDARLVLQKLVSEHAGSPEAERGKQKLAELAS